MTKIKFDNSFHCFSSSFSARNEQVRISTKCWQQKLTWKWKEIFKVVTTFRRRLLFLMKSSIVASSSPCCNLPFDAQKSNSCKIIYIKLRYVNCLAFNYELWLWRWKSFKKLSFDSLEAINERSRLQVWFVFLFSFAIRLLIISEFHFKRFSCSSREMATSRFGHCAVVLFCFIFFHRIRVLIETAAWPTLIY